MTDVIAAKDLPGLFAPGYHAIQPVRFVVEEPFDPCRLDQGFYAACARRLGVTDASTNVLNVGDRVLRNAPAHGYPEWNGIYVYNGFGAPLTRAPDCASPVDIAGSVFHAEASPNGEMRTYASTFDGDHAHLIELGETPLYWSSSVATQAMAPGTTISLIRGVLERLDRVLERLDRVDRQLDDIALLLTKRD